ncbi:hypothetical protein [Myxococcus landrumensis]|uniref:Beta-propeller repeat protein n=1 Tax=Myxococcus landrumensis TaxID=2813577 RepID=A0ABX7NF00_9BACT|nr:hypothetical protein [Myxococcus landrumus]QSQ16147.1 hypothetical protein JY572_08900 [Myxococcus landrumus]
MLDTQSMGQLATQADGHLVLVSSENSDVHVSRFNPKGQRLWRQRFGDANHQYASGVVVDAKGNTFITGDFWGELDLGGGPLPCPGAPGSPRAFAAKLDATGRHVWSRCFGDMGQQQTGTLALAPNGDVFVGGYFGGSIDFGDGPIPVKGTVNQFVARLGRNDGATVWHQLYETGLGNLVRLASDREGNLFISDAYTDTLSIHGEPWLSTPGFNAYVLKLNPHGQPLWAKDVGPAHQQTGWRLAVDREGNLIGAGAFFGTLDLGGGPLVSQDLDVFVVSLDSEGNHRWSRRFGGPGPDWGHDVNLDPEGNPVVTGSFTATIDLGTGPLTSAGLDDIFVMKLGRQGTTRWSRAFGDLDSQTAYRVVSAGRHDVVLGGPLVGTIDFGSGPVTRTTPNASYLARITPR